MSRKQTESCYIISYVIIRVSAQWKHESIMRLSDKCYKHLCRLQASRNHHPLCWTSAIQHLVPWSLRRLSSSPAPCPALLVCCLWISAGGLVKCFSLNVWYIGLIDLLWSVSPAASTVIWAGDQRKDSWTESSLHLFIFLILLTSTLSPLYLHHRHTDRHRLPRPTIPCCVAR